MSAGLSVGAAAGVKPATEIWVGAAGGAKQVTEGWVGTAAGNRQFFSSAEPPEPPPEPTLSVETSDGAWQPKKFGDHDFEATAFFSVSGGSGVYVAAEVGIVSGSSEIAIASADTGSAYFASDAAPSTTFVIVVYDSLGAFGVSNTGTIW